MTALKKLTVARDRVGDLLINALADPQVTDAVRRIVRLAERALQAACDEQEADTYRRQHEKEVDIYRAQDGKDRQDQRQEF